MFMVCFLEESHTKTSISRPVIYLPLYNQENLLTSILPITSQGAQVVSLTTAQLPSSVTSQINAVVLFGNPNGPDTPVPNIDQSKTKIFCAAGDNICAGGDLVLPPHLSYGSDAGDAASFIESKVTV